MFFGLDKIPQAYWTISCPLRLHVGMVQLKETKIYSKSSQKEKAPSIVNILGKCEYFQYSFDSSILWKQSWNLEFKTPLPAYHAVVVVGVVEVQLVVVVVVVVVVGVVLSVALHNQKWVA